MAVEATTDPSAPGVSARRMLHGSNVVMATVLVIGIVVVLQLIAYQAGGRWDMTSSGVNSLSEGTENLLRNLDSNVTLTSLYFETDRETEDQPRYRRSVQDLLDLYAATNRGKVTSTWINPLKDHEKFKNLLSRLREHPAFTKGLDEYKQHIEAYTKDGDGLDIGMNGLVAGELKLIGGLSGGMGDEATQATVGPLEMLFTQWSDELKMRRETVESLTLPSAPQYTSAVSELKTLYRTFADSLKRVVAHADRQRAEHPDLPAEVADLLAGCQERFAKVSGAVDAELKALQDLDPPKFDDVLRQLNATGNAILVETDEDVMVVDYATTWPPLDPTRSGSNVSFFNRAFKGEEKVTAAILRATHKEQTAVVFVRYGGTSLFMGGFMPGQPQAPYAMMKGQLEDANFVVAEWDLKTADTPPDLDPKPTRTIYVVLKPTPAPRDPMGRPSQEPPFTDTHRRRLIDALGDSGRAVFIAGWFPGPFGPIPGTYEYDDYLKETWGIDVDTSVLLVEFGTIAPGRFHLTRQDFFALRDMTATDHEIVRGAQTARALPWCAPLERTPAIPEGVELTPLLVQPKREGVWGIHNIQDYEKQLQERNYMTRGENDLLGPFTLAMAGTKGDAKVVVVSSREFAEDGVAFSRQLVLGAQGVQLRSRNPGNVTLLVNSLHWLNDKTEFLNIGQPIELSVLRVDKPSTVTTVQVLTIVVWPMLALIGGGTVWWVRRR